MSVTHVTIHKRADNCRDRVGMTHSFSVCRPARRPSRPCAARWDMTLRSLGRLHSPGLSRWVAPMASTRSPLERASCGSRSTLAAESSGNLASVSPPFFKQVAHASEGRYRTLLPHRVTSLEATMGGAAYTDHAETLAERAKARRQAAEHSWDRIPIAGEGG